MTPPTGGHLAFHTPTGTLFISRTGATVPLRESTCGGAPAFRG